MSALRRTAGEEPIVRVPTGPRTPTPPAGKAHAARALLSPPRGGAAPSTTIAACTAAADPYDIDRAERTRRDESLRSLSGFVRRHAPTASRSGRPTGDGTRIGEGSGSVPASPLREARRTTAAVHLRRTASQHRSSGRPATQPWRRWSAGSAFERERSEPLESRESLIKGHESQSGPHRKRGEVGVGP